MSWLYQLKSFKIFPALSYFVFFLQCIIIYMGVSGPSLLIESIDSMINNNIIYNVMHTNTKLLSSYKLSKIK